MTDAELLHLTRMYPEIKRADEDFLASHGFSSLGAYLDCGRKPPPGTDVDSIQTGGGGNYTTWAGWESALTADHTTGQTGEQDDANDAGACEVDVSNSNNNTITMTVSSGNRFSDQGNWPSCADVEGSGARIVGSGILINQKTNNVVVEWLQLSSTDNVSLHITSGGVASFVGRFLMIYDSNLAGVYAWNGAGGTPEVTLHHLGVYNGDYAGIRIRRSDLTANIYHCTLLGNDRGYLLALEATVNCYNCIAVDTNNDDYEDDGVNTIGGNYNMSSDTTAPGATNWQSVTSSNVLEDVTAGNEDLHLLDSVDGSYGGGSGYGYDTDIEGTSRVDYDVGWHEIVAAAAGHAGPLVNAKRLKSKVGGGLV